MVDEAVRMVLEPSSRRQLGEDGLVVFWRDGREPGRREGLACILSMCPHPDCACQDVHVDGFVIDEQSTAVAWDDDGVHVSSPAEADPACATLEEKMIAIVDPDSGETWRHRDRCREPDHRPRSPSRRPARQRHAPGPRPDHRFLGSNGKARAGNHQTPPPT